MAARQGPRSAGSLARRWARGGPGPVDGPLTGLEVPSRLMSGWDRVAEAARSGLPPLGRSIDQWAANEAFFARSIRTGSSKGELRDPRRPRPAGPGGSSSPFPWRYLVRPAVRRPPRRDSSQLRHAWVLLNLTHRDSREEPSPLEPGRAYDVSFELDVTSWVFEPGHGVRLDLAGTDWPNCWPPPAPLTLTIGREGSQIVLPIVDGPPPIAELPDLPASRRPQAWDTDGVTWRIEWYLIGNETRAVVDYHNRSEADVYSS